MGQLGEKSMIWPEVNVILFTFFVIPNLLANATIWGIGELANVFVLASTGLKLTFLLLVVIDWLFSVLQNHLLNFFTGNTILCNFFKYFMPLFLLCTHLCLP